MPQTVDLRTHRDPNQKSRGNPNASASAGVGGATSSGRVPPHNLQAEESLLGAMLLSRDAIFAAVENCSAADFYKPAHAYIFDAIHSLWGKGEPADVVTVADELSRADLLEAIGGPSTLISLQANTPATSNAARYARIVEELALLRRLIQTSADIAELGYSVPDDVSALVDTAESMMFNVAQRRVADTLLPIRELLSQSLDRLESLYDRGEAITGVPTGFNDLDQQLSGLQPSNLVIVGARPAMGKCVAWDTQIIDPSTGDIRTAAEVYRRGAEGADVEVMSLDHQNNLRVAQPSAYVDDGVKPVFSVRTKLGRRVRTTLSHPFLTRQGWTPLSSLRPGSCIAVPRVIDVFGIESQPQNDLALLAFALAGGKKSQSSVSFVSPNPAAVHAAARAAFEMGARAIRNEHGDGTYSVVFLGHGNGPSPVANLLARQGLLSCANSNCDLPSAIYRLPKKEMAYFLNCLLSVDATIVQSLDGCGEIKWNIVSGKLAQSVQHLLLRFGINAQLQIPRPNSHGQHVLTLTESSDIRRFAHEINAIGYEEEIALLVQSLAVVQQHSRVLVGAGASSGHSSTKAEPVFDIFAPTLWQSQLDSFDEVNAEPLSAGVDIRWDEIVSIEYDGDEQVYDLTIPYTHNFVAGDVIVHNTSFALNIVSHAALSGVPSLYFSLEMSHIEITQRLLCSEARVDASRLRNGRLHDSDWPKINNAIGRLGETPIYIDDNPNLTIMDIRAKARRLKAGAGGLGLVVIDYMQLMSGRSNAENRQVEVSEMSRGLKILARELNVPVIALSQLSRNLEMRSDKRPALADLRESGSLEQDADVVMFLYRDEVYSPDSPDKGSAEIIVAKHRNGPVGTTNLAFLDRYTRFENFARV